MTEEEIVDAEKNGYSARLARALREERQKLDSMTRERDEARALANNEFAQIQKDLAFGKACNDAGRKENDAQKAEIERLLEVNRAQGARHAKRCEEWAKTADQEREAKESLVLQVESFRKALALIADPMSETHRVCSANWPEAEGSPCNCDRCTAKAALDGVALNRVGAPCECGHDETAHINLTLGCTDGNRGYGCSCRKYSKKRIDACGCKPSDLCPAHRCPSVNGGGIICQREKDHCGTHFANGFPGVGDLTWGDTEPATCTCPHHKKAPNLTSCRCCSGKVNS